MVLDLLVLEGKSLKKSCNVNRSARVEHPPSLTDSDLHIPTIPVPYLLPPYDYDRREHSY